MIPSDIQDAALDAFLLVGLEGTPEAIARAILAERERCAKVAESWEPEEEYLHGDHYEAGLCDAGERIAATLRTPSTGEEQ